MFYCEPCRVRRGWPHGYAWSQGPCELCQQHASCHEMDSAELPKANADALLADALIREGGQHAHHTAGRPH